jgi:peroxiredoxin Q/BCP
MLRKGDRAPDLTLPDQDGEWISLSALWEKGVLVLFFYPRDHTLGCTQEACAFRDGYEELQEAGAEVVGISSDDASSHRRFREEHRLPYPLLSDEEGKARKAYGVRSDLGLLPGRVSFVIGKDGTILSVFNSQLQFKGHFRKAYRTVLEAKDQGR